MQSSSCRQAGRGRNCGEKVMLDWSDDAIGENRVTKPDWVDFKASPPRPASTTFEGHSMRIHRFFFPSFFYGDTHMRIGFVVLSIQTR